MFQPSFQVSYKIQELADSSGFPTFSASFTGFQKPIEASLTLLLSKLNIPNLFNPLWKTFQTPHPSCLPLLALLQPCFHLAWA